MSSGRQGEGPKQEADRMPRGREGQVGYASPDEATVATAPRNTGSRKPRPETQPPQAHQITAATRLDAHGGGPTAVPFGRDGVLDGRYRLVKPLGEGGMGAVYLVEDMLLRKRTALKTLVAQAVDTEEELERFRREAAIAHSVHHPNVARTYDIGEQDGVHYITMEALQGETLMDRLRAKRLLDSAELREVFTPLCRGLRAAHVAGIVHRDLKPANIMLVPDGRKAVVMDFGIAGAFDDDQPIIAPTEGGASTPWDVTSAGRGTPAYMAPEQWDEHHGDARTDIYALGVIMYVALTAKAPFPAKTMEELAEKHRSAPRPDVSTVVKGVDADIAQLITRCLQADPAQRPQSMDEVIAVLGARGRRRRYLRSLVLTTLVTCAAVVAVYAGVFHVTKRALIAEVKPAVERLARLVAADVSVADLDQIHTREDMKGEPFKRVLKLFQAYAAEDPQVKFVYAMRKTHETDRYRVVVDSDPDTTDDNGDGVIQPHEVGSVPGDAYNGVNFPMMRLTLETGKPQSDDDFAVDQWGISISGYAPLPGEHGKAYFVGADVGNMQLTSLRDRLRAILGVVCTLVVLGYAVFWWPLRSGGTLAGRFLRRKVLAQEE